MKKSFLFLAIMVIASLSVFAQKLEYQPGAPFSIISSNGKYFAGNTDGVAYIYNSETGDKGFFEPETQDDGGYYIYAISDNCEAVGSKMRKSAIWTNATGWELLPEPEDITDSERSQHKCKAISADGKTAVVEFGSGGVVTSVFVYTRDNSGLWTMTRLPNPTQDPLYKQPAQFANAYGVNDEGTLVLGRYRISLGWNELPFVWYKNVDGVWDYKFVGLNIVVKDSIEAFPAEFPGELTEENMEEYMEYDIQCGMAESGVIYDLSGMMMNGTGKYVAAKVFVEDEETLVKTYWGVVVDLEKDTVLEYKFEHNGEINTTCISVDNNGVVSLATPSIDYFRYGFISTVQNPNEVVTLADWAKEKSNGVIDLAKYMVYDLSGIGMGNVVATGTATLANSGNGFVTNQYNAPQGAYESFFAYFDVINDVDDVYGEEQLSVYPNPTAGILNLSAELTNVAVFDVTGRQVMSQSSVVNTIDLSALNAGIYYIVGISEGKRVSTKIVLTK